MEWYRPLAKIICGTLGNYGAQNWNSAIPASYFDLNLVLTKTEFDLLYTLASNPGIVVTREQLLDRVWGYDFEVNTNVVDVFVGYLRKKMEDERHPRIIETIRGVGYMLKK